MAKIDYLLPPGLLHGRFVGCCHYKEICCYKSGDNLGSNRIGGFVESFSNEVNYYCRTCLCTKTEVQNIFSDENISLRTPQNYEQHVTELLTDNMKDSLYGIKRSSPFNSNLFHVTRGLPPDIAHDMIE
ncbi:hypothetical protein AVEN_138705-1 [Araneus ventricosus]|uniref:Uncharacterized protein n=1 Tax=Araneus ventricosus TaxID=182803 RepID=A0A4Y2GH12_ARAVE|nr:hypothetical protein AVEN_138705-1 [Araneus ventricosus]